MGKKTQRTRSVVWCGGIMGMKAAGFHVHYATTPYYTPCSTMLVFLLRSSGGRDRFFQQAIPHHKALCHPQRVPEYYRRGCSHPHRTRGQRRNPSRRDLILEIKV